MAQKGDFHSLLLLQLQYFWVQVSGELSSKGYSEFEWPITACLQGYLLF